MDEGWGFCFCHAHVEDFEVVVSCYYSVFKAFERAVFFKSCSLFVDCSYVLCFGFDDFKIV